MVGLIITGLKTILSSKGLHLGIEKHEEVEISHRYPNQLPPDSDN